MQVVKNILSERIYAAWKQNLIERGHSTESIPSFNMLSRIMEAGLAIEDVGYILAPKEIIGIVASQSKRIAMLEEALRNENARIVELLKINLDQTKVIMDQSVIINRHKIT